MSKSILHINGVPLSIGKIPICLDYTIPVPPPDYGPLLLQFITDDVGEESFSPEIIPLSGTLWWDLGDGSIVFTNSFVDDHHIYQNTGNKTVKVYAGTTDGSDAITDILMSEQDIVGILDISSLTSLNNLYLDDNLSLTTIKNPKSSVLWSNYSISFCDLTGTLDVSGLTGLGGSFSVSGNPNLTNILNPVSSEIFTSYSAFECDLTGELDLSQLTNLGGYIGLNGNPNLTKILHSPSSQELIVYNAFDCGLDGSLDLSGFQLGSNTESLQLLLYNNYNLTELILPASNKGVSYFQVYNCNLTGTLDISGLTNMSWFFEVYNNPNLQHILNPPTSGDIQTYYAYDCSLAGTLDISGLTIGSLMVQNNNNLTQILNPSTNRWMSIYYAYNCNLTGTLDLTTCASISGNIQLYNNPNLTEILLPTTLTHFINNFDAHDCSLSQTSVDAIFNKIRVWLNSHPPIQSLNINLHGGTNSWPTGSWDNTDIVSLQNIFFDNSAGGTRIVDISINVEPAPPELPLLVFYTEASTNAFDPQFTVT